jgi:hypothetical protein
MARLVFIVSRQRPELLDYLQREYAGPDIEVIQDRRTGARRVREVAVTTHERRRGSRRRAAVDDRLQALGWAIVWRQPGTRRGVSNSPSRREGPVASRSP